MEGHNGVVKVLTLLLLQNLNTVQTESCLDGVPLFTTNMFMFFLYLSVQVLVGPGTALLTLGNASLLG